MKYFIATIIGIILGYLAGLVGVGGGEFRLPVLLYVFKLPVLTAITANLLVGLVTVVASSVVRLKLGMFKEELLLLVMVMSFTSIIFAYFGARLTDKLKTKTLKIIISIFLILVGVKFILKPLINFNPPVIFLPIWQKILVSLIIGMVVGMISGIFGVAGGEFRIPLIVYFLGLDVKLAGTTSLLVSIPTVASGFLTHHQLNHLERKYMLVILFMGLGSLIGSYFGACSAYSFKNEVLEITLGVVLILATIKMVTKP